MADEAAEQSTASGASEQEQKSAAPASDQKEGGKDSEGRSTSEQGTGRTAADKERSRQQSRSISGREAARTVGARKSGGPNANRAGGPKGQASGGSGGRGPKSGTKSAGAPRSGSSGRATSAPSKGPKGGNRSKASSRPGRQAPARRAPTTQRRSPTTLLTIGTVAVVIVVVVVLVVVKVTGGNSGGSGGSGDTTLPSQIAYDIQNVPASAFNKVGVTSSAEQVTPPTIIKGQPPLTFNVNGKDLPGIFFYGAEYCPYCAAERWALSTSLARFGKFTGLKATSSTTGDIFPGTQTISFYGATLSSPYVAFKHVEAYTNQLDSSGDGYVALQKPTKAQIDLVEKYDTGKYIKALQSSSSSSGSIPFVNWGNKALISGAQYSPALLAGLSRSTIASNLSDPSNSVTQAILAASNYNSAVTCAITGQKPASVCTSKGVTVAAKKLKLSS